MSWEERRGDRRKERIGGIGRILLKRGKESRERRGIKVKHMKQMKQMKQEQKE